MSPEGDEGGPHHMTGRHGPDRGPHEMMMGGEREDDSSDL